MLGLQTAVGDERDEAGEGRQNSINGIWNREEGRTQDSAGRILEPERTSLNRKLEVPVHGWSTHCMG